MSFGALSFVFDDIPSEKFDLFLCNINDTGIKTTDGGGEIKVHTDKTPSMDFNYLMGVEYDDVFEFTMTFGSNKPKDRYDISIINNWLIGHTEYKKLQIIQHDTTKVHYNCILNNMEIVSFGNYTFAFQCKVICDRPWAITKPKVFTYQNPTNIKHFNNSHTTKLTYPKITFTTNSADATVSIVNTSNKNWETKFENLSSGEKITLDNQLQIITSSMGLRRLSNFNKHWFELVPKQNNLIVTGNVKELTIEYSEIRKIG